MSGSAFELVAYPRVEVKAAGELVGTMEDWRSLAPVALVAAFRAGLGIERRIVEATASSGNRSAKALKAAGKEFDAWLAAVGFRAAAEPHPLTADGSPSAFGLQLLRQWVSVVGVGGSAAAADFGQAGQPGAARPADG